MVVFLVAAGALFLIGMIPDNKSPSWKPGTNYSQPTVFDPDATVRGLCMMQIKAALHDPDSAEFESSATTTVRRDVDTWTVLRPVRAKNSFNAVRRSVFECRYKLVGKDFQLLGIREAGK